MHLGNNAITPACSLITWTVALTALTLVSLKINRTKLAPNRVSAAAALGAAVFAAQLFNFPILSHSSAHLVGGVLLAWLLGPALGVLTMSLVLLVQALLLNDGGIVVLGANILNMALLPAGLVAMSQRLLRPDTRLSVVGVLAGVSMVLGSGLIVAETLAFRSDLTAASWGLFARYLVWSHVWIGLVEGLLTITLLALLSVSPGLAETRWPRKTLNRVWVAGLALAGISVYMASARPDAYAFSLLLSGLENHFTPLRGSLAWLAAWQDALGQILSGPVLLTTLLATATAGGITWLAFQPWSHRDRTLR